jgi:YVTN family beta-propeller protein
MISYHQPKLTDRHTDRKAKICSRIISLANFDILISDNIINYSQYMPAGMSSCPDFIAVLLSLAALFVISYSLPQQQPFVMSFAYLPGQAIVTSNDECEPDSLVHCIAGQPREKGVRITTATTTSSETSNNTIGQSHDPNGLGTLGGGFLYVGNAKSNSVSVIDLTTNAIIKNITVGKSPHDIKISDDQQTVYTTDMDSGTVSIINATSNTLINQIQTGGNRAIHGIAIFNDTLYVGDVYGGKVLVIRDGQIKNEIKVGSGPEYIEISPDGKFLYVANLWSPISVVDVAQNKVIKEIDSGITPHGLSFTDDGSRLFIVNMKSNTLSVIDATTHEVIKTISVGNSPEYVALTPDEGFAIVTNLGSDTVSIVDAKALQVVKEIPIGGVGPHGIAFSADGDMAYISNMNSSDISVINMTTGQVTATFPSGGIEPHQIVMKKPSISIASAESKDNDNNNTTTTVPLAQVYVDIANDPWEHARGLMFKKNLEWNNGMLFAFEDEKTRSFWMKNTSIPLDMLFIDSKLTIVDIKEDMQPCIEADPCPSYISKQPARFVLELNAGFVHNKTVNVGDRLVLNVDNNGLVPRDNEPYFDAGENFDGSAAVVEVARQFLISKLPELGIQVRDETMLHTDMVVTILEELEIVNGQVLPFSSPGGLGSITRLM